MANVLDIFNNDAFSLRENIKAINDSPQIPDMTGNMFFDESGITTQTAQLERKGSSIALVPTALRGEKGMPIRDSKAKMIPVNTVHLPQRFSVMADEVAGVREFGTTDQLKTVQSVVAKKAMLARRNLDITLAWQKLSAIKGKVVDADGTTVLMDMFTTFGFAANTVTINMGNTEPLYNQFNDILRLQEDTLGGIPVSEMPIALCSKESFDKLRIHSAFKEPFKYYANNVNASGLRQEGIIFNDIVWKEFRGQVNGQRFIGANKVYLVPRGIPGMFNCLFGPANYMETVNTVGLPYYMKMERLEYDKGVEFEVQSNPLIYNAYPSAVIELTI
jgi:Phage major capsid protein E